MFVVVSREFFDVLVRRYQADTFVAQNETGIVVALSAVAQVGTFLNTKHLLYI